MAWMILGVLGALLFWLLLRVKKLETQVWQLQQVQRQLLAPPWSDAASAKPSVAVQAPAPEAPPPGEVVPVAPAEVDVFAAPLAGESVGADSERLAITPTGRPSSPLTSDLKAGPVRAGTAQGAQTLLEVTSIWRAVLGWFGGGNLIVRLGILVLLAGVVFLLRLAVQTFEVPIEARLGVVALGGFALTGWGIWLRERVRGYALTVQGGGLVVLYLTIFAGLRLYPVLPAPLAFALLVVLAAISAWLAVAQNALALALLAFGGAFAAPLLASTGQGNALLLFGYVLIINMALAWVANRRTWRALNVLGALFTFGLAGWWGWRAFNPQWRWPLELILLAHMALYWFVAVRYTQQVSAAVEALPEHERATAVRRVPLVDGGLLFGVPLLGFGLQAGLVHGLPFALAISSGVWAAVYLLTGLWLQRHARQAGGGVRLLTEGAMALGSGFVALVLPLAIAPRWMALGWSVQGGGMVWLGQRQQRRWSVRLGLGLQVASIATVGWSALWNAHAWLLPLSVLSLALWCSAYWLREAAGGLRWRSGLRHGVVGLAVLVTVWLLLALGERWLGAWWQVSTFSMHTGWALLAVLAALWVATRQKVWMEWWQVARWLLPASGLLLVGPAPLLDGRAMPVWLAPLLWLAVAVAVLKQQTQAGLATRWDQAGALVLGGVLLAALPAGVLEPAWGWPLALVLPLALVALVLGEHLPLGPFGPLHRLLRGGWSSVTLQDDVLWPLVIGWLLWLGGATLLADGQLAGLPYVPLLSPLDGAVLAALGLLWRLQRQSRAWRRVMPPVLALSVWLFLSGLIGRTLHAWAQVPLLADGGWHSDLLQSSLTVGWSVLAALLMVWGSRRNLREIWLGGAVLLGVVLIKLVLVDWSSLTALARVVSFMGAGLLMLLVGYLAPLPPARPLDQALGAQPMDEKNHAP